MPIYEYQCQKCGEIEEALQKFSDKPLTKCKHCSGKLHKLVSQSSFHLKGTGWYVTDYTNRSKDTAAAKDKKSEKTAQSKTKEAASKPQNNAASPPKKSADA
jgi:putative FmdB family regulatory protein